MFGGIYFGQTVFGGNPYEQSLDVSVNESGVLVDISNAQTKKIAVVLENAPIIDSSNATINLRVYDVIVSEVLSANDTSNITRIRNASVTELLNIVTTASFGNVINVMTQETLGTSAKGKMKVWNASVSGWIFLSYIDVKN